FTGLGSLSVTSGTLNYNGGTLPGTEFLTNAGLNLGAGGTGAATFVLSGSCTLSGDVAAGQTLWVRGGGSSLNTTVTAASGFTNTGLIRLESITAGHPSNLTVQSGTLLN